MPSHLGKRQMGEHQIKRRNGEIVTFVVDDSDDDYVRETGPWCIKSGYLRRNIPHPDGGWIGGKRRRASSYLHRELLGLDFGDKRLCDHINGDTLDNRRSNLRIVTSQGNSHNCVYRRTSSSRFQGVVWRKRRNKWEACIRLNGHQKHLGHFTSEEEAHEAYLQAKRRLHPMFVESRLEQREEQNG